MSKRVKRRRVEYTQQFSDNARMRHVHEMSRGIVTGFSVQFEAFFGGRWYPVVRYDSAHGFSHKDVYNVTGESRKTELTMSYAEALTFADRDIGRRWQEYASRFDKGEWP